MDGIGAELGDTDPKRPPDAHAMMSSADQADGYSSPSSASP
jgi:hypothetical protein